MVSPATAFVILMIRRPPRSTLLPYTPLYRSEPLDSQPTNLELLAGWLRFHSIETARRGGLGRSPVVSLQRPGPAGGSHPVGAGHRLFAFQSIDMVRARTAPVEFQILLFGDNG